MKKSLSRKKLVLSAEVLHHLRVVEPTALRGIAGGVPASDGCVERTVNIFTCAVTPHELSFRC